MDGSSVSMLIPWLYPSCFDCIGKCPGLRERHTEVFRGDGTAGRLLPLKRFQDGGHVLCIAYATFL